MQQRDRGGVRAAVGRNVTFAPGPVSLGELAIDHYAGSHEAHCYRIFDMHGIRIGDGNRWYDIA